jgi:serine/threonine-protein kinase
MAKRAHDLNWTIPRPGENIAGKYVIEGLCGRGGLAAVLSAMHVGLDQRVAIKLLLPEWADEPNVIERFLREGRAATRIRSEHVVRVFDVGTLENGAPYLVLEYLEGHNLDDVIAMWGPLPVPTAVDWVLQAAEAIAEAHSYGIIHRDLKPANLFLTRRADGSACVKVIDFGLSKLTDPNMAGASDKLTREHDVLGSPHYMAPEQLRATRDAGPPADVWALGAVLHELLTGQTPFRGETMPELCATVLTQPPVRLSSLRPSIPGDIEAAVLRCLEKEPEARFATLAEFARAIAPYGTPVARQSCARIERVLEGGARTSEDLSLPPMPPMEAVEPVVDEWPSDAYLVPRAGAASLKTVFGSLIMLSGLGAAAFMWMYSSVHPSGSSSEPARVGVTAPQGSAPTAPPAEHATETPPHASVASLPETAPHASNAPAAPGEPPANSGPPTAMSHTHLASPPRHTRTSAPVRTPAAPTGTVTVHVEPSPVPPRPRDDAPPSSSPSPATGADDPFSGRK